MGNKWTEESVKKAIEFVVTEYKSVGARVVAEQLAELATQIQADMQAENERLNAAMTEAADIMMARWGHANAQFDPDMLQVIGLLTGKEL